jgi:hypothetical protein
MQGAMIGMRSLIRNLHVKVRNDLHLRPSERVRDPRELLCYTASQHIHVPSSAVCDVYGV